jgi:hypothetical protein
MTARLTEREARRAGLLAAKATRTTRRTAPREKGTTSLCVGCGATFTTIAAEDRHVALGHNRFESVLS